jgi:hypothetical protein
MRSTPVFAALCACRAARNVVPAAAFGVRNVAENLETLIAASICGQLNPRFRANPVRKGELVPEIQTGV